MANKRQKSENNLPKTTSVIDSQYELVWQNLTITDDFIFGKIMSDPELCIELLRRIFPQYDIDRIEYIKVQENIRLDKEAKGIQLDVFVKDNKNVAFCVEMQTRNVDNLDYVAGKEPEEPSEFIVKLKTALHHAKQNREWRREHMIWYFKEQDIRADALKEGIDIGRQEGIFAMIALCLENDLSQDHILRKLQKHFHLMPQEAQEYLERYYQEHK